MRGTFGLIYWQRRQHVKLILVFYVRGTLGTKITCTTCRSAKIPCSDYYVSVCNIDFGNKLYRSLLYFDMMCRDGKFPSGTNWEDFILWCLVEMGKECDRDNAAKIDLVANKAHGDELLSGLVGDVEEERGVLSLSDNNNYPDATFFKFGVGFLARALWGFIPIHDSAGMQSDLFGNAKISASVGRKTASRAQMRRFLIEQKAASVDNRPGRKRRSTRRNNNKNK